MDIYVRKTEIRHTTVEMHRLNIRHIYIRLGERLILEIQNSEIYGIIFPEIFGSFLRINVLLLRGEIKHSNLIMTE